MKRRFTDHELFVIRNEIPIQLLIETKLKLPNKIREGRFRFLSPCCGEFNTSIKPETNLARCFRCDKNFNTIDMVISVRNFDFVNSVKFLQHYHEELSCNSSGRRSAQPSVQFDMGDSPSRRKKCTEPLSTKKIFEDMTVKAAIEGAQDLDTQLFSQKGQTMVRLSKLENEMMRLSRQIEQILTFLKTQGK